MTNAVLYFHLFLALFLLLALILNKIAAWRIATVGAAVLLLLSGAHNFMVRMVGAPKGWHAFIGIKVLLALHVITMVFLIARGHQDPAKLERWRKSALGSAVIVALIGLYYSNFAGR
jgi:uncharacterized membrane protein